MKLSVAERLGKTAAALSEKERLALITESVAFAETDLLCYHSDEQALKQKQMAMWEPVLKQVELAFAIRFERTDAIIPVKQPSASVQAIHDYVTQLEDDALIVLAQMTQSFGSVLLAAAWMRELIDLDEAIACAQLDEHHQAERWGVDEAVRAKLQEKADLVKECAVFYTENRKL